MMVSNRRNKSIQQGNFCELQSDDVESRKSPAKDDGIEVTASSSVFRKVFSIFPGGGAGSKSAIHGDESKRKDPRRYHRLRMFTGAAASACVWIFLSAARTSHQQEAVTATLRDWWGWWPNIKYDVFSPRGPPRSMVMRGRQNAYEAVPPESRRTFHIPMGTKFRRTVARAFRNRGWRKSDDPESAHVLWDKGEIPSRYRRLKPWQRYNNLPGSERWETKDGFIRGFERYRREHRLDGGRTSTSPWSMIPESYRLNTKGGRAAFRERLEKGGGINRPWVLKQPNMNNGKGVEMLGPHSDELRHVLDRVEREAGTAEYIIQEYVCNELTWWGNKKFDLRFYWAVASVDPLIVLYHDGYVRVGNAVYNETEFSQREQHLTTHTFLADEEKGTIDELRELIRQHYLENVGALKRRIKIDPFQHVRYQFMEAIAETVRAFKDVTFGNDRNHKLTAENGAYLRVCLCLCGVDHQRVSRYAVV
jgi:Tubulin-tyrosine ligase family